MTSQLRASQSFKSQTWLYKKCLLDRVPALWLRNHHQNSLTSSHELFRASEQKTGPAMSPLVHWSSSKWRFTSFPFVSPFSIHSTVTLSLSSFRDVTIASCMRPVQELRYKIVTNRWICGTKGAIMFVAGMSVSSKSGYICGVWCRYWTNCAILYRLNSYWNVETFVAPTATAAAPTSMSSGMDFSKTL